ncbi:MAG: UDP-N-acetylmuramate:L-alanyl-gamma-D-glutamyl-meso-diaminopimelate ligase [Vicinamibacterales bacterium]
MRKRVHFIGICGVAMATLAALLRRRGADVSGSDQSVYPPMSDFLVREGIAILDGYRSEHITDDVDLVVVGNAISRGNVELEEVLDRRIRYASLPEVVRDEFLWAARPVVIAGTHGKTTTTALAAWVLTHAGLDPSALIGGIAANFDSGCRLGAGAPFVIEGDEYDSAYFDKTAKFLKYIPEVAVVNNVEFDHADIYPDLDAILLAFRRFVLLVPRNGLLLLGGDDRHAPSLAAAARCRVATFGTGESCTWRAKEIVASAASTHFTVYHEGAEYGRFEVPLLGSHNVRNALAVVAIGNHFGLEPAVVAAGLRAFLGVKRRLELRGEVAGVAVFDDFAHHPTAIAETLRAVRQAHPGQRVWAVFEPRSATSCLKLFESGFAAALGEADVVVIAAVFRSSLPEDTRLDPVALVARMTSDGREAYYVPTTAGIVDLLAERTRKGDLIVIMSNGGFDNVHGKVLDRLRRDRF